MTREEKKENLDWLRRLRSKIYVYMPVEWIASMHIALDATIQALEQEPRKDEVILTKEEYGELVSSEFDNGYAQGYREALKQEPVLDKIYADIQKLRGCSCECSDGIIDDIEDIIDKYKAEVKPQESEEQNG